MDAELERRKELGFNFQQILERQKTLLNNDETAREAHQVAFEASLREAIRVMKSYANNQGKGGGDMMDEFDDHLQHRYVTFGFVTGYS